MYVFLNSHEKGWSHRSSKKSLFGYHMQTWFKMLWAEREQKDISIEAISSKICGYIFLGDRYACAFLQIAAIMREKKNKMST